MTAAGARGPADLQIWLADLEALSSALESADARYGLLSTTERDWPAQAPPESRRWRRLARIALRSILARAGAPQAHGVEFQADTNGKPSLPGTAIAFNASHAGGLALFAVAAHGPVGIDLESERDAALSERRRAMINAAAATLSPGTFPTTFLQSWTCLEAFAKARGTGIGALLTELGITASGAKNFADADVAARASAIAEASNIEVFPLQAPANFFASVAAPRPISRVDLVMHTLTAAHLEFTAPGITAV